MWLDWNENDTTNQPVKNLECRPVLKTPKNVEEHPTDWKYCRLLYILVKAQQG